MKLSCCAEAPCTTAESTASPRYRTHVPSCHRPPMSTAWNTSYSSFISCCVSNTCNNFLFLHKCDSFIMENKGFWCFLANISQHIVWAYVWIIACQTNKHIYFVTTLYKQTGFKQSESVWNSEAPPQPRTDPLPTSAAHEHKQPCSFKHDQALGLKLSHGTKTVIEAQPVPCVTLLSVLHFHLSELRLLRAGVPNDADLGMGQ